MGGIPLLEVQDIYVLLHELFILEFGVNWHIELCLSSDVLVSYLEAVVCESDY